MKTIKVIDLLNKIANDEEVPNKIIYNGSCYYNVGNKEQAYYENDEVDDNLFLYAIYNEKHLNDEVEIIEDVEEDKKIEKLNISYLSLDDSVLSQINTIHCNTVTMEEKINELIDVVNKLNK